MVAMINGSADGLRTMLCRSGNLAAPLRWKERFPKTKAQEQLRSQVRPSQTLK